MGPGDGIQIQRLMDLPTTLETADSVSNPNISSPLQATQQPPGATVPTRVKSMFQQSSPGGKLPSRLPSHHPQRSISHNEVSWMGSTFLNICIFFLAKKPSFWNKAHFLLWLVGMWQFMTILKTKQENTHFIVILSKIQWAKYSQSLSKQIWGNLQFWF